MLVMPLRDEAIVQRQHELQYVSLDSDEDSLMPMIHLIACKE